MKWTQQKQFIILVEFMQEHPDLSKGLLKSANGRNTAANLWKRLSTQLNAAGPPIRDITGWKKVWADYKVHLRAKLRRNKQSISGTDGGPFVFVPLSGLEESVSKLLNAEKSISGTTSTPAFGAKPKEVPRERVVSQRESSVESSAGSDLSEHGGERASEESEQEDGHTCSNTTNTPRRKQSLLEYQVENQVEYQTRSTKMLNEINNNLINIFKVMKKSEKIEKKRLKLEKEKFIYQQKVDNQKIKLTLSKLELQKDALEIFLLLP